MSESDANKILFNIVYKAVPWYVAIVLGMIRYQAIKEDGLTGYITYSRLMKAKLITSYLFGIMYLIPIILAFTVKSYWLYGDLTYWSILYVIFTVVWIFLAILMTLEHERSLPQVWYCHQFFWVTNFVFVIAFSTISYIRGVYEREDGLYDYSAYWFTGMEVIVSLLMVIYMLKTKPKRLRKIPDRLAQSSFTSDKMPPKVTSGNNIEIVMEYKINKKAWDNV